MFGELQETSNDNVIQLEKERLRIGRREDCDIVLPYGSVSSHHCLMEVYEGYWYVKDLKSKNGVRISGKRIKPGVKRRINPGESVSFGKHEYVLEYEPQEMGAQGLPPSDR